MLEPPAAEAENAKLLRASRWRKAQPCEKTGALLSTIFLQKRKYNILKKAKNEK
jgi:hypothetical protein